MRPSHMTLFFHYLSFAQKTKTKKKKIKNQKLKKNMLRVTVRRRILRRASSLQHSFHFHWNQILACTLRKSCTYRQLPHIATMSSPSLVASERGFETPDMPAMNTVGTLRTCFLTTYVGGERQEDGFEISNSGLNQMDKTLYVGGARIAYRIWEVVVARAYARALNATLFVPSATYNINVNKIFKFITAKLFNLPWAPVRNLTIGELIIDF
ncbi:unnamed protein product [Camellia sinensis]